jgi:hypothetical protein
MQVIIHHRVRDQIIAGRTNAIDDVLLDPRVQPVLEPMCLPLGARGNVEDTARSLLA